MLRGPEPTALQLDPEPDRLRPWNLDNLNRYWRRWAESSISGRRENSPLLPTGWVVSWGTLGASRLHHTIETGEIISKTAAGEYALETFDREWHPIIREGLAFQRCEPTRSHESRSQRVARAGAFVLEVVHSANALPM